MSDNKHSNNNNQDPAPVRTALEKQHAQALTDVQVAQQHAEEARRALRADIGLRIDALGNTARDHSLSLQLQGKRFVELDQMLVTNQRRTANVANDVDNLRGLFEQSAKYGNALALAKTVVEHKDTLALHAKRIAELHDAVENERLYTTDRTNELYELSAKVGNFQDCLNRQGTSCFGEVDNIRDGLEAEKSFTTKQADDINGLTNKVADLKNDLSKQESVCLGEIGAVRRSLEITRDSVLDVTARLDTRITDITGEIADQTVKRLDEMKHDLYTALPKAMEIREERFQKFIKDLDSKETGRHAVAFGNYKSIQGHVNARLIEQDKLIEAQKGQISELRMMLFQQVDRVDQLEKKQPRVPRVRRTLFPYKSKCSELYPSSSKCECTKSVKCTPCVMAGPTDSDDDDSDLDVKFGGKTKEKTDVPSSPILLPDSPPNPHRVREELAAKFRAENRAERRGKKRDQKGQSVSSSSSSSCSSSSKQQPRRRWDDDDGKDDEFERRQRPRFVDRSTSASEPTVIDEFL